MWFTSHIWSHFLLEFSCPCSLLPNSSHFPKNWLTDFTCSVDSSDLLLVYFYTSTKQHFYLWFSTWFGNFSQQSMPICSLCIYRKLPCFCLSSFLHFPSFVALTLISAWLLHIQLFIKPAWITSCHNIQNGYSRA